eukprot:UN27981
MFSFDNLYDITEMQSIDAFFLKCYTFKSNTTVRSEFQSKMKILKSLSSFFKKSLIENFHL